MTLCDSCFREIESGEKYIEVRKPLVGELVDVDAYCNDCATVEKA